MTLYIKKSILFANSMKMSDTQNETSIKFLKEITFKVDLAQSEMNEKATNNQLSNIEKSVKSFKKDYSDDENYDYTLKKRNFEEYNMNRSISNNDDSSDKEDPENFEGFDDSIKQIEGLFPSQATKISSSTEVSNTQSNENKIDDDNNDALGKLRQLRKKVNEEKEIFKVYYPNGNMYEGEMLGNKADGQGKLTMKNGNIYQGQFVNDFAEGKGEMIYANGAYYKGDFVHGKFHGKGTYYHENHLYIYEGDFKMNKKTGKGKKEFANGDEYVGNFINGKLYGKGKMTYNNGDVYEGNWYNSEKDGYGVMTYKNGNKYMGNWKYNRKNGKGKMIHLTGNVYDGEWKDDVKVMTTNSNTFNNNKFGFNNCSDDEESNNEFNNGDKNFRSKLVDLIIQKEAEG